MRADGCGWVRMRHEASAAMNCLQETRLILCPQRRAAHRKAGPKRHRPDQSQGSSSLAVASHWSEAGFASSSLVQNDDGFLCSLFFSFCFNISFLLLNSGFVMIMLMKILPPSAELETPQSLTLI